jgi:hypothetical protein
LEHICFSRTEVDDKVVVEPNLVRLQTLDHAKKEKAEKIILVLFVWLHRLVTQNINGSRANQIRSHQKALKENKRYFIMGSIQRT